MCAAQWDGLGQLKAISPGGWHATRTWSIITHTDFSAFSLLWKRIELTRLPLIGMFAASQVITYKAKPALRHIHSILLKDADCYNSEILQTNDSRGLLLHPFITYSALAEKKRSKLLYWLYLVDPSKKKVGVQLHELLGAVGHGYRLNSCALNTGCSDKQGAQ